MRASFAPLVAAVAMAAFAGCGDDHPGDPVETATTSTVTANDLEGQSFGSTEVTGHSLVPGTTVSLTFAEHRVSAISGCNTQNADVEIVAGRLRITSDLASTDLECERSLRDQDRWIAAFLGRAPIVELHEDTLTLTNSGEAMELEARF